MVSPLNQESGSNKHAASTSGSGPYKNLLVVFQLEFGVQGGQSDDALTCMGPPYDEPVIILNRVVFDCSFKAVQDRKAGERLLFSEVSPLDPLRSQTGVHC